MSRLSFVGVAAVLGALVLTTLPQSAKATDIIYTLSGFGAEGSFNSNPFSGANFTITAVATTTNTTLHQSLFPAINLTSLTYNITGITGGDALVNTPMQIINENSFATNYLLFANPSATFVTAFFTSSSGGWDLASSLGPLPSTFYNSEDPLPTDQGDLNLTGWSSATFTAAPYSVTPEAPGLVQLLPGLLPLGALALRRRRSNKSA